MGIVEFPRCSGCNLARRFQFASNQGHWGNLRIMSSNGADDTIDTVISEYFPSETKFHVPVNIGGSGYFQCVSGNVSSINLKGVGSTDMRFGFMNSSGTQLGFLYGTSSLDFGFLDAGSSWSYRHTNDSSHCWFTNGGTFRALLTAGGTYCATGDIIAYSSDKILKCNVLTISCEIDRIK